MTAARAPRTPLDVLLVAMQRKWAEGDVDGATALARAAAPYLHPRHAALRLDQTTPPKGTPRGTLPVAPHLLSDAQLNLLLADTWEEDTCDRIAPDGDGPTNASAGNASAGDGADDETTEPGERGTGAP